MKLSDIKDNYHNVLAKRVNHAVTKWLNSKQIQFAVNRRYIRNYDTGNLTGDIHVTYVTQNHVPLESLVDVVLRVVDNHPHKLNDSDDAFTLFLQDPDHPERHTNLIQARLYDEDEFDVDYDPDNLIYARISIHYMTLDR